MTGNDYQKAAARTLIAAPDFEIQPSEIMLVWNAIGLGGESGEVLELLKKSVFHRKPLDPEKLKKELGDVLWYVAAICTVAGLSLSEVMEENDAKLRARYPDGWNNAQSHQHGEAAREERAVQP